MTNDRLKEIEDRVLRNSKIIEIIGKKMSIDFDDLLNEIDQDQEAPKMEDDILSELDELDDLLDDPKPEPENKIDLDSMVEEQAKEDLASEPKTPTEKPFDPSDVDFADETISYGKSMQDIELRQRALKDESKDVKADYADQGVDIKQADRARKEVARELQESALESKEIEDLKRLFLSDDNFCTMQVSLNG